MTTRVVRLLGFVLLLCALSCLPAFAAASPGVRVVRLSLALGDVQIDRNSGDGWEQAINNMPVIGGARIYAAEEARAELEFEDGSSLRLVGPGQISLIELSSAPDGAPSTVIQVASGVAYINARVQPGTGFRILAPTGESFAITAPSHLRFKVDEQVASLSVFQGEAKALSGVGTPVVHAGQSYNYILGQPESSVRADTVQPQSGDSWDRQRDSYNDQYEAAGAANSGSDDPNAPGVADLGAYGSYQDLPGYGVAWQPSGVDDNWDPFANGAWCDYPDLGWTFVSGYPWGWAPYYYGDWFYVGGRGWWWRPGRWGGRGHTGGFHARPHWTGSPSKAWNAPHPPAHATHGTVAVAGSHLSVGPIGQTHAPTVAHGFTTTGLAGPGRATSAITHAGERFGPSSAISRESVASNRATSPIVGQKGSYALASGASNHRNGYEVHRPPAGFTPHSQEVHSGVTPRSYAYNPGSAPIHLSAPVEHAPSVSSGGGFSSGSGFSHGRSGGSTGSAFGGGGHSGGGGHR
jgi:uncharacterized membrane protein YgcG